jgi:hypothetical protein
MLSVAAILLVILPAVAVSVHYGPLALVALWGFYLHLAGQACSSSF